MNKDQAFEKWWSRQCYEESDNAMFTAKAAWDIQQAKIDKLTEVLDAAIRELNSVTVIKDGMPNVSHNLMYNLRAAREALSSVEK